MNKIQKYTIYGLTILVGIFTCLGAFAKIWEVTQPKQYLLMAKVQFIERYSYTNDMRWSSRGYRIYIIGENKPIDFPLKNWKSTVQEDELDGLSIDDHK
jgi:hypothetical protein